MIIIFLIFAVIFLVVTLILYKYCKGSENIRENIDNIYENSPKLIIVHHGNKLPEYIDHFIDQAVVASPNTNIYFCLDENLKYETRHSNVNVINIGDIPKSTLTTSFENNSKLDKNFRDGFWHFCSKRFTTLYDFIKWKNFKHIFHMEYDNLLYVDLENLYNKMKNIDDYKNSAGIRDSENQGVPSFMYFNDTSAIEKFATFMTNNNFSNDMETICRFIQTGEMGTLPLLTKEYAKKLDLLKYEYLYKNEDLLGCVFDGRSAGQFIGGIDPRNTEQTSTIGFINTDSLYNISKLDVAFDKKNPMVCGVPICNLHIHSKDLHLYKTNI